MALFDPTTRLDPSAHLDATAPAGDRRPACSGDVVLLRWPADAAQLEPLGAMQVPRLLLVETGTEPPATCDALTDWVRVPAPDAEVEARVRALRARVPRSDGLRLVRFRLLCRGTRGVLLPSAEARMMTAFLAHPGGVVPTSELAAVLWPAARRGVRASRVVARVRRLRRRVAGLGVRIARVQDGGFRLETELARGG